jgi:hypothetical protein
MIDQYNRRQLAKALICVVGSVICWTLAWWFFRYVPEFAAGMFGSDWSAGTTRWVGLAGMLVLAWSGFRTWKSGGGLKGFHESAFYFELEHNTSGAYQVERYAQRVTGPAHVLSQLFLGGPLLLLRACTLLSSLVPNSIDLESRLKETLSVLGEAKRWQPMTDHPRRREEILYLARMGLIDFSAHTAVPRIKALSNDGN